MVIRQAVNLWQKLPVEVQYDPSPLDKVSFPGSHGVHLSLLSGCYIDYNPAESVKLLIPVNRGRMGLSRECTPIFSTVEVFKSGHTRMILDHFYYFQATFWIKVEFIWALDQF